MQIAAYSLVWVARQKQTGTGTADYLYHSESSRALLHDVYLFLCSFLSLALLVFPLNEGGCAVSDFGR